jgi:hypothetical protein
LAGSSSNLFKRSIPKSVHEKKQNVPAAVAGASLHMPANFAAGDWDWDVTGMTHTSSVMMNKVVWRFTMFSPEDSVQDRHKEGLHFGCIVSAIFCESRSRCGIRFPVEKCVARTAHLHVFHALARLNQSVHKFGDCSI